MNEEEKQAAANLIQKELDLNLAILITIDKDGYLSMAAASRDEDHAAQSSVLLSRLSDVLFGKLKAIQPTNRKPI